MILVFNELPDDALLRLYDLCKPRRKTPGYSILPFAPATLWRKVKEGNFPSPIRLPGNITAWKVGDVRAWLHQSNLIDGRSPTPAPHTDQRRR